MFVLDLYPCLCGDVRGCGLGVVHFVYGFEFFVESAEFLV